ncbi:MAG TPA: transposase, partial [Baekduia sp.]|nr:transposase [Baekduia sp.]
MADVRLAALMLDGLELKGGCCVVALGVTTDGVKVPLGLWDGSTENKRVCVELLADLAGRGLDCDQGVLVVLDGGKALRAAVDAVVGHVHVQAAFAAKERTSSITCLSATGPRSSAVRAAWKLPDHEVATDRLEGLATELAYSHPGTAAPVREGLRETVTLQRLGVHQQLWKTLSSTDPIESMIAICRATSPNVKRWQNGDMRRRWTAAGMLEAERQFCKIIDYKHLAQFALAVEGEVAAGRAAT